MSQKIDKDHARFRKIIRGKIKKNLRKYIVQGDLLGKKGKDKIVIPVPQIELPRFRFGSKDTDGVGRGEGEPGDSLDPGEGKDGTGEAGDQEGEHILEEVTYEELAEMMSEELELPFIEQRGKKSIESRKDRYTSIRRQGPESLRNFRRTFKQALKRQISSGTYNPKKPRIIPIKEDKRYRSWKEIELPETNAVIIYMMDVSGSMGSEQKDIVRTESFWIDVWLRAQYDGIESRYIIHDSNAREVDRETFFHTRESGGTVISSAYNLCLKIIQEDYNPAEWNIYPFHFSDGDNWGSEDSGKCTRLLEDHILPLCNMFCYGQVESPYGTGEFLEELVGYFGENNEKLVTSNIADREEIIDSIKAFLGKGK